MSRSGLFTAIVVAALTAVPQVYAQVPVGDFYFFDRSEAGNRRVSVTTVAEENIVTGAGGLTWTCEDGTRRLIVSSTYLGRSMRAGVRWAFDGDEMSEEQSWIQRRTGMAVIAPAETEKSFTGRALESSRVVLEVSDDKSQWHTYTFTLAGPQEALAMLQCEPVSSGG
ncbi:MAG: hypothetical protein ACWGON_06135 [Gemmatimonadota bacterium]